MKTIVTLGLGALAMYLLDPEQGPRRRARLRDQWMRANRASGPALDARSAVRTEVEPQQPLETPPSAHHLGR